VRALPLPRLEQTPPAARMTVSHQLGFHPDGKRGEGQPLTRFRTR
jgi:hypothetical protein